MNDVFGYGRGINMKIIIIIVVVAAAAAAVYFGIYNTWMTMKHGIMNNQNTNSSAHVSWPLPTINSSA